MVEIVVGSYYQGPKHDFHGICLYHRLHANEILTMFIIDINKV